MAGQVSQILCQRGQAVEPGEPILLIAERSVREIVAYLDEDDGREIRENTPVLVSTPNGGGVMAESIVLRVSPGPGTAPAAVAQSERSRLRPRRGHRRFTGRGPHAGPMVDVKFLD